MIFEGEVSSRFTQVIVGTWGTYLIENLSIVYGDVCKLIGKGVNWTITEENPAKVGIGQDRKCLCILLIINYSYRIQESLKSVGMKIKIT